MPETPAAVTDTHPLLFHAAGGKRLGRRARAHFDLCERRQALCYVPAAVLWEVCLLVHAGRVDLGRSPRAFFADLFGNPAYQDLPLDREQVCLGAEHRPNADPFDALVLAAATALTLPLLTRDPDLVASDRVRVLWD